MSRTNAPQSRRSSANIRAGIRQAYRGAILNAAESVFGRAGFQATRMADIAQEAGVAVGTLYNYFESKEAILREMATSRRDEFYRSLEGASETEDPIERLQAIVIACFQFLENNSVVCSIFMELGAVGEVDIERLGGPKAEENYSEFLALLERELRAAVTAGRLRKDVKVQDLVAVLSGSMNGAVYSWLKRGKRGRLVDAADPVLQVFLQGAQAAKSTSASARVGARSERK